MQYWQVQYWQTFDKLFATEEFVWSDVALCWPFEDGWKVHLHGVHKLSNNLPSKSQVDLLASCLGNWAAFLRNDVLHAQIYKHKKWCKVQALKVLDIGTLRIAVRLRFPHVKWGQTKEKVFVTFLARILAMYATWDHECNIIYFRISPREMTWLRWIQPHLVDQPSSSTINSDQHHLSSSIMKHSRQSSSIISTWIRHQVSASPRRIYQWFTIKLPPVTKMCQGLNSHYFHIIGDGHQPNSRGLYTHYKDSY